MATIGGYSRTINGNAWIPALFMQNCAAIGPIWVKTLFRILNLKAFLAVFWPFLEADKVNIQARTIWQNFVSY
jgi:hypothetical protein